MSVTHPNPMINRPLDRSMLSIVEETSPEDRTTYPAQCHCGAIKYDVTLKYPFPKYTVNKCTCSICTHNGYLLVYPCRRDVLFTQGYDNLQSYSFNTKTKAHKFCKSCGSSVLIDFLRSEQGETDPAKDTLAINVRNFKDIDLDALEYTFYDGRNLIPSVGNSE